MSVTSLTALQMWTIVNLIPITHPIPTTKVTVEGAVVFFIGPNGGDAPLDADGSPMGRPQDDEQLTQRAAAEAVRLSAKALRMTLQKIGGDPVTGTGNVVGSFETAFFGGISDKDSQ